MVDNTTEISAATIGLEEAIVNKRVYMPFLILHM